ncbi:MAG: adenylyltransferase/cytidyltransferase family protein [Patescibacteria group bacterium]
MLKFFFKYFNDKIPLSFFTRNVVLKLLKQFLKKDNLPESYIYEFDEKTVQKTLDFMHKKQNTIDAMWLQRGIIQENKKFNGELARGSSTTLRLNNGRNYLSDEELNLIEKRKAKIIKDTHQKLENIYKNAILNPKSIFQSKTLMHVGEILCQGLNQDLNLSFHRGNINQSLKLYFKRVDKNFDNSKKTGIFIFDENIDLLIKGEEFIFNVKVARAIEKNIGGRFYLLNPFSKNYIEPRVNNILNTGVYDLPHLGHASKIKNLKNLLDKNGKLIIALTNDKNAMNLKNKQIIFSAQNRKTIIESLKYADKVMIESEESQIFKTFYSAHN